MRTGNHMIDQPEDKDLSSCDCGGEWDSIVWCSQFKDECECSMSKCKVLDDDIPDCEWAEERLQCNKCSSVVEAA